MNRMSMESQYVMPRAALERTEALAAMDERIAASPEDAKLWFERAKLCAGQFAMREAIECLSRAIAIDPLCGIYYRWRGHRHLNCSDVEEACADLTVASRLIPDNFDVWYHLALCCVLLGRYAAAEYAHDQCWKLCMTDEHLVPLVNWSWINQNFLGNPDKARALLEKVRPGMDVGPNGCYLRMTLAYKGDIDAELLREPEPDDDEPVLGIATQMFGLAHYYLFAGDKDKYEKTMDEIVGLGREDAWNCFGYAGAWYLYRHM